LKNTELIHKIIIKNTKDYNKTKLINKYKTKPYSKKQYPTNQLKY